MRGNIVHTGPYIATVATRNKQSTVDEVSKKDFRRKLLRASEQAFVPTPWSRKRPVPSDDKYETQG